jgi:hypothetical protein
MPLSDNPRAVRVLYTNHRGTTEWRSVEPMEKTLRFRSTEWHPECQWVIDVWDLDKKAVRTFAVKDIKEWVVPTKRKPDEN